MHRHNSWHHVNTNVKYDRNPWPYVIVIRYGWQFVGFRVNLVPHISAVQCKQRNDSGGFTVPLVHSAFKQDVRKLPDKTAGNGWVGKNKQNSSLYACSYLPIILLGVLYAGFYKIIYI